MHTTDIAINHIKFVLFILVRYLSNEDMRVITKNCSKIEYLDISGCDGLDQGIFKHISKLLNLKVLIFNNNQQPLGDLQSIKILTSLTEISLENSCIIDI